MNQSLRLDPETLCECAAGSLHNSRCSLQFDGIGAILAWILIGRHLFGEI
jgi:hypothetical protein